MTDGVTHAAAEMLRSGTTCFNDMYFFSDAEAEVIEKVRPEAQLPSRVGALVAAAAAPLRAGDVRR
eukprot:SAG11_NODE_1520_length_4755_cov_14.225515_2_plen_66_part_00